VVSRILAIAVTCLLGEEEGFGNAWIEQWRMAVGLPCTRRWCYNILILFDQIIVPSCLILTTNLIYFRVGPDHDALKLVGCGKEGFRRW
jgi:hypothetical protein